MKTNTILKTVALGAFAVGMVAIGGAVLARVKRIKDESETAEALVKAEVIAENFSGARGSFKTGLRSELKSGAVGDVYTARGGFCKKIVSESYGNIVTENVPCPKESTKKGTVRGSTGGTVLDRNYTPTRNRRF